MTKANVILKRAELFEKLALYGKRIDFLKALAQDSLTPQDVTDNLHNAISLINGAANALSATLGKPVSVKLDNLADIEQVQNARKELSIEVANASNTTDMNIKTKLIQIRNALMSAQERINRNLMWRKEQQNIRSKELEPADVLAIPPGEYGEYTSLVPSDKKPATDNMSLFNFYYKKLEDANASNNLKEMMDFSKKLESIIAKIGGDSPYLEEPEKSLVDKGNKLVTTVQNKLYMR